MKEQSFKNHAKLDPAFHFVGSVIMLFTLIGSIVYLVRSIVQGENIFQSVLIFTGAIGLLLTFGLVRLYSLKVQDRIIRAEENFRIYRLTGKTLDDRLTLAQLIALRFAPDEEFPELYEKTVTEKLAPVEIKKAIKNWKADHLRV
ncbi:MAG: DUF6526 family protein [Bacillota bacterium]|nr:DUF6526 family protein [Bacillota bacterium]MDP4171253.1 DUF6526 family protein [Bacillota bacterium]